MGSATMETNPSLSVSKIHGEQSTLQLCTSSFSLHIPSPQTAQSAGQLAKSSEPRHCPSPQYVVWLFTLFTRLCPSTKLVFNSE